MSGVPESEGVHVEADGEQPTTASETTGQEETGSVLNHDDGSSGELQEHEADMDNDPRMYETNKRVKVSRSTLLQRQIVLLTMITCAGVLSRRLNVAGQGNRVRRGDIRSETRRGNATCRTRGRGTSRKQGE